MKGKKTYSFGTGRESFSKTVINREKLGPDAKNPGPGNYSPERPIGRDAVGFKLKFRVHHDDPVVLNTKWAYPGAGTYEDITAMSKDGKYHSSLMLSSKSAKWSKDARLKPVYTKYEKYPGPGYYEHLGSTSEPYTIAGQFHSIQTRGFGTQKRQSDWTGRNKTPGPGTYIPPSDFGYVSFKKKPLMHLAF